MKLLNGLICLCLMASLVCLGACSGSSNGTDAGNDGDDGNNGDPGPSQCGTQNCSSSERCINDTVCVPLSSQGAQACEEDHDNIFSPVGAANLSCHNIEPCSIDTDCGQDDSGAQLVCKSGFCGVAAPSGGPAEAVGRIEQLVRTGSKQQPRRRRAASRYRQQGRAKSRKKTTSTHGTGKPGAT